MIVKKNAAIKIIDKMYMFCMIFFACCIMYAAFMAVQGDVSSYNYNGFIVVLGVLFLFLSFVVLYEKLTVVTDQLITKYAIAILICFAIISFALSLSTISARPVDLFNLHNAAISYLKNGYIYNEKYFSMYPFQQYHTLILVFVYWLGARVGIVDYRISGTVYGVFLLVVSAWLIYLIGCKVLNKRCGFMALVLFCINPVFPLYASYYYTDLPGMAFFLLIIYIFLVIVDTNNSKKKFILSVLLGIVVITGYKMRATTVIALLAIFCVMIYEFFEKRKMNKMLQFILVFCISAIITSVLWDKVINILSLQLDHDYMKPLSSSILVGLNVKTSGRWSQEYADYAYQFATYNEKTQGNLLKIKEILNEIGFNGVISLWLKKIAVMWSDGMTALLTNLSTSEHYGLVYQYAIGNKRTIMSYYVQILRTFSLIFAIPLLLKEAKRGISKNSLPVISFCGYMLFHFFWEVHEKYAFMALPYLILISVIGFTIFTDTVKKVTLQIDDKNTYVIDYIFFKKCSRLLLCFILFFALIFFKPETKEETGNYNFVVQQSSANLSIPVKEELVKQSFEVDQHFNAMYIRFENKGVPDEQTYIFSIHNGSDDRCLYEERFEASTVEDDTYRPFVFDYIEKDEGDNFYFTLQAEAGYADNIKVYIAGDKNTDYYSYGYAHFPDGTVSDITFRIYNIRRDVHYKMSYYMFIVMMLIIFSTYFIIFFNNKFKLNQDGK